MGKKDVGLTEFWPETLWALEHEGALLVAVGRNGKPNAMTIGWATLGTIWGRHICTVLVRPSRYTYGLLEESGEFTINVLPRDREADARLCGSRSGRDLDKLAACGLTPVAARKVRSAVILEAIIHYECRVVMKSDVVPEMLSPEIHKACYPQGDFHRVYFGEVLAVYADPDAAVRASGPGRKRDASDQSQY